jgi:hypothetical protein
MQGVIPGHTSWTKAVVSFVVVFAAAATLGTSPASSQTSPPPQEYLERCPDVDPYIDREAAAYAKLVKMNAEDAEQTSARSWKAASDQLAKAKERCAERLVTEWKTQTAPPYDYNSLYYASYIDLKIAEQHMFEMQVDWWLKGDRPLYDKTYDHDESYETHIFNEANSACFNLNAAIAGMVSSNGATATKNDSVAAFMRAVSKRRIELTDLVRAYIPHYANIVACD